MKFDRNTVLGFVVLALLFFGYFYYNSKEQNRYLAEKRIQEEKQQVIDSTKRAQDSIANFKNAPQPGAVAQPVATAADSAGFLQAVSGNASTTEVNTDLMHVVFSNKGGQIKAVELKQFAGPDGKPVTMAASDSDQLTYNITLANNRTASVASLYFAPAEKTETTDSTVVTYKLRSAEGQEIVHRYVVHQHNYMIDLAITINGVQQVLGANVLNLTWENKAVQQQKDIAYERGQSKVGYRFKGDFDSHIAPGGGSKEFDGSVNWVAVKQQFFNATLVAKN
ncbi:MAG TPA: membrane protein insertase YidC, partial [Flavisolibacter sp.]|nr:membrane protein insertase YidC [Flavisolibacter sp.]